MALQVAARYAPITSSSGSLSAASVISGRPWAPCYAEHASSRDVGDLAAVVVDRDLQRLAHDEDGSAGAVPKLRPKTGLTGVRMTAWT
jgi:hypothetical protein